MVELKIPSLKIGRHEARFPIIQGGMGIMISGPRLAGAVAAAGGIGTIASVGLAVSSSDYDPKKMYAQNVVMLKKYIAQAREAANDGIIAVNCMCALTDYDSQVRASCESGADIIISGAGLPLRLPELTADFPETALVPIVSSVKAANIIISRWLKYYNRLPDAFVVETPNTAGGHLGARDSDQAMDSSLSLANVVPALVSYLKEKGLNIPVVSAGGIWDSEDMMDAFAMGASGVQMGTRFAATEEGDSDDRFKQAYVNAEEDDVVIIQSPCGLPGRALRNPFVERYLGGLLEKTFCKANCLSHCLCKLNQGTFCIADALISAYKGDWENGLFFCGTNVSKVKSVVKVKDLVAELMEGCGVRTEPAAVLA